MQPILGEQEMFGESPTQPNLGELNLQLSQEIQKIHGDLFHDKRLFY